MFSRVSIQQGSSTSPQGPLLSSFSTLLSSFYTLGLILLHQRNREQFSLEKLCPFRSIPPYPPHPLHSPSFPSISSFPLSLSTTPFCPYHFLQSFLICTVMFNEPMCSVPVLLNQRLSPSLLAFASFLPGTASLTPTLNPPPTTPTRPINRRSALRALEQDRNAEWGWTF